MTGDRAKFTTLTPRESGYVTIGDNSKRKILGVGSVGMTPNLSIENVLLVDGLKFNLLSISKLCDKDYKVEFEKSKCSIKSIDGLKTILVGQRHDNVYMLDSLSANNVDVKCLAAINDNSWLWHRRMGHINFKLISKLARKELVTGLPKIGYTKDKLCSACQYGK